MFDAFRDFSRRFDEVIEDLARNKLQIRSADKPNGMFASSLDIKPVIIHYIRSSIQETTSFDEFVELVFTGIEMLVQEMSVWTQSRGGQRNESCAKAKARLGRLEVGER